MPVTALDAVLPALADRDGCAVRTAALRHRLLVPEPHVVVPFQIGGEAFALAAVAWGSSRSDFNLVVVPDPRERELFYQLIEPFAAWVDWMFQSCAGHRDVRTTQRGREVSTIRTAPQLVVPNNASAQLLGRVGRRLAYLDRSTIAVEPALVAAGRHLLFLREHLRVAGQQLIVPLTELLASHWATPQMPAERLSLPALAAWINPPKGVHGFNAAQAAEVAFGVGPVPSGDEDEALFAEVERFRAARGIEDRRAEVRAIDRIERHWAAVIRPAWDLSWQVLDAERYWPEAPSTERRWREDREAYTRHIDWQVMAGHRRVRPTPRQAAITQYQLESAAGLLEAEEAIDDPLRMIPYVLRGEALMGEAVRVDSDNRERTPGGQMRTFPLVTIATQEACSMPLGKELWWSDDAGGASWCVREVVAPAIGGGRWHVTLRRAASMSSRTRLPRSGEEVTFSTLHCLAIPPNFPAEVDVPWTHRSTARQAPDPTDSIDGIAGESEPTPTDPLPTGSDLARARDIRGED